MADNVLVTPGSGATIAADEVTDGTLGSVKVQYVKLMDGTLDGTTKGVISSAGLKVDLSGTAANSTAVKVDASSVAVPITDNSGSLTVDAPVGTPVFVTPTPSTTGGWTYWSTSANNSNTDLGTTVVAVKASQGTLGGWYVYNPNTSVAYLQIFDVASGSVTLGTTRPKLTLGIPASGAANLEMSLGVHFGTAISIAASTTPSGSSANSTALPVNILYK
jgi:hypothetical protein